MTRTRYVYDKKTKKVVRADGHARASAAEALGLPMVQRAYAKKAVTSYGMSVTPGEAAAMRQTLQGIAGAEVAPNGRVTFTCEKARHQSLRRVGFHDNDGFK